MATSSALLPLLLILISINISTIINGDPDTTVLTWECSPDTWSQGDPYGELVNDLLDELATETLNCPSYINSLTKSDETSSVFGYAQCNQAKGRDDCGDCCDQALIELSHLCPFANSATMILVDCQMKYLKQ